MYFYTYRYNNIRDAFIKKTGKMSDIEQKGGRGLSQNHSFLLPKKNDICVRKEGVKSSCHVFLVSK